MRDLITEKMYNEHINIIHDIVKNKYISMKELITNEQYVLFSEEDVFLHIYTFFLTLEVNNLYILNVNEKFDCSYFTYYLPNISETIKTESQYINNYKVRIIKFKNTYKTILIIENLDLFMKIYNKEYDLETFKQKFNIYSPIILLLCKGNGYDIINELKNKKKIRKNLVFKDCFEKFIPCKSVRSFNDLIRFFLTEITYIKLQYRSNINYDNIYSICKGIDEKKLNINFYSTSNTENYLKSKLFDQDEAVESVLYRIKKLSNANIDETKPLGSWLLCGPSGTGKTELAKILCYTIFNSHDNLIKINMAEYVEKHAVSKLIGSPPGYSGYGEDTILSTKFKTGSSFVILFDEIEKAHTSITDLMLQILDKGKLTLSNGDIINFNNSFIIFTSNIGYTYQLKGKNVIDKNYILEEIRKFFRIEFLNRLNDIIIFNVMNNYDSFNNVLNKFIKSTYSKFYFYTNIVYKLKYDIIALLHDPLYGSRPLRRFNEYIIDNLLFYNYTFKENKNYNLYHLNNFKNINIGYKFRPIT
ncbi:AAA domain (Cdc48 subfamily) family protein (apicoplast) [Theileria parva strain Muguga]|uniref:ClpC molecular chaperone, putative n=1 Tax=Theileria parva TaxID=5875 RepID=Q4MY99_THEPA|nr:AAA domain (Cdc48 subfamily) family protein [Theileria parva strain Muguga]|eukprot:XP_762693.1 molecular chaperone (apicoplast) [Theileria parva strain Muguga]